MSAAFLLFSDIPYPLFSMLLSGGTGRHVDKMNEMHLLYAADCGVAEVVVYGHCDGLFHDVMANNIAIEEL